MKITRQVVREYDITQTISLSDDDVREILIACDFGQVADDVLSGEKKLEWLEMKEVWDYIDNNYYADVEEEATGDQDERIYDFDMEKE